MKTVTSVSGGRTSAYLAANYPTDELVFALVRIEDENCRFKDEAVRRLVEDRIQAPFIGTAEDDMIIYTLLDLEQYLGRQINWVTGLTFDRVVKEKGGWLPNKLHRYCTTVMKLEPIFYWWAERFGIDNPVKMNIGYRANESSRANKMLSRTNKDGFIEMKGTFDRHANGDNKWITVNFELPCFPLIENGILKTDITKYWEGKAVRFADYNNCVGCFHREPLFLRFMFDQHPAKMGWFKSKEGKDDCGKQKGQWRADGTYSRFEKLMPQTKLYPEDFSACDSGYCEIS